MSGGETEIVVPNLLSRGGHSPLGLSCSLGGKRLPQMILWDQSRDNIPCGFRFLFIVKEYVPVCPVFNPHKLRFLFIIK